MQYIGSKYKLLTFLHNSITSVVTDRNFTLSDLFAGTGTVGKFFKQKGHSVIANDLQYYSYVMNRHFIGTNKVPKFTKLKEKLGVKDIFVYLNELLGTNGFIFEHFCPGGVDGRMYFSDENGQRCDAIRIAIQNYKKEGLINNDEYFFLLASLLEAIDKVANTTSVYGAYLKKIKKAAQKSMAFIPLEVIVNGKGIQVENQDVNKLANIIHDVVYLDPPYNARQYSGNYHVLETIARYDNPELHGKTGMRDCSNQKSTFCSKTQVKKEFKKLIDGLNANYIFVSYNDEGLLSLNDIKEVLSIRGTYGVFEKKYQRFKADTDENRNHTQDSVIEYLHYVVIDKH